MPFTVGTKYVLPPVFVIDTTTATTAMTTTAGISHGSQRRAQLWRSGG